MFRDQIEGSTMLVPEASTSFVPGIFFYWMILIDHGLSRFLNCVWLRVSSKVYRSLSEHTIILVKTHMYTAVPGQSLSFIVLIIFLQEG